MPRFLYRSRAAQEVDWLLDGPVVLDTGELEQARDQAIESRGIVESAARRGGASAEERGQERRAALAEQLVDHALDLAPDLIGQPIHEQPILGGGWRMRSAEVDRRAERDVP